MSESRNGASRRSRHLVCRASMMMTTVYFAIGSYLWGSIPSAYLVARFAKGIDIRTYGSRNAGAANVMAHVGMRTGFLLGVFDCLAKGTIPVVIARLADQGPSVQAAVGLAAIAGHNWSPYLRFSGGRGVATAIGVIVGVGLFWESLILAVVMGVVGRLMFRDTGLLTFIAMLTLPVLAYLFQRPPEIIYMTLVIALLLISKRLTTNWEPPSSEYPLARVMVYRVLWDRDVPRKKQWTDRRPPSDKERPPRDAGNEVLR